VPGEHDQVNTQVILKGREMETRGGNNEDMSE
jgi:hypothetical protein